MKNRRVVSEFLDQAAFAQELKRIEEDYAQEAKDRKKSQKDHVSEEEEAQRVVFLVFPLTLHYRTAGLMLPLLL